MTTVYSKSGLPEDLLTSKIVGKRQLKTSSLDSFNGAGASGRSFARTIPITIQAGQSNSVRLQKNSNVAVRFIRAKGLFIDAIRGSVTGDIISLESLISTNGVTSSDFFGSIEVFNDQASGNVVLGAFDELSDSFYPDGQFCIDLRNPSSEDVSTFLSIGAEQVSDAGVYITLEPNTQLEPTTEMSGFNGTN